MKNVRHLSFADGADYMERFVENMEFPESSEGSAWIGQASGW